MLDTATQRFHNTHIVLDMSASWEFLLDARVSGWNERTVRVITRHRIPPDMQRKFFWHHSEEVARRHGILITKLVLGMSTILLLRYSPSS